MRDLLMSSWTMTNVSELVIWLRKWFIFLAIRPIILGTLLEVREHVKHDCQTRNINPVFQDNVFCGDSLFHTDIGTARCDFPGGSASSLYHSAQKLLGLPEHVKIWTGHDYLSEERDKPVPCMSVQEHKNRNGWVKDGVALEHFVKRRQERDKMLKAPRLLHPSLQVNIHAGRLPALTELGQRLLYLPLRVEGEEW
jgi:hypothetical protein